MMKKICPYLLAAAFVLAAQPVGAFDAGKWFTDRVAALDKAFSQSQKPARFSGGERHSSGLRQVMKHLKDPNHQKKQHRQR